MFRKIAMIVAIAAVLVCTTKLYVGANQLEENDEIVEMGTVENDSNSSENSEEIQNEMTSTPEEPSVEEPSIIIPEQTIVTPEPVPVKLEINIESTKTNYFINEELDFSGIQVALRYDDESIKVLTTEDFVLSEVDTSSVGEKTVTVTSGDFSCSYTITVDYNIIPVNSEKKYSSTDLNLREGPGTDYAKLTTVPYNTELIVIGTVKDLNWSKVIYNNQEYFCSSNLLSNDKVIVNNDITITKEDMDKYGTTVKGEAGAKSSVILAANKYWHNTVPQWLKNKFANSGWRIIVSETPLNKRFGYSGSIAGLTSYGNLTIYLDNRETIMDRTIIHELGHFVDYENGFVSYSDEFEAIFAEEKYAYRDPIGVGDGHHISNSTEYFASVFRDIIVLGKDSLGNIPKSYEFVSRYIG